MLRIVVPFVASLVLLEAAIRFLMFSDHDLAVRWGELLRQPDLYADRETDELWWTLHASFAGGGQQRTDDSWSDDVLGWHNDRQQHGSLRHVDESEIDGRRPVLIYGDSYAACHGYPNACWKEQLADTELAKSHAILNYAVSGYALDQIYLMVQLTVDYYADLDPVVVIAVQVDDTMMRVGQRLRSLPKPWFEVDGEALVLHLPERADSKAFVADDPPKAWSYLWRIVLRSGLFPVEWVDSWMGVEQYHQRTHDLCRHLLRGIHQELEARDIEHFFLLFHGPRGVRAERPLEYEAILHRELGRLGVPWVASKVELLADIERTGQAVGDYFGGLHYRPETYRVVAGTLLRGLEGRFDSSDQPSMER